MFLSSMVNNLNIRRIPIISMKTILYYHLFISYFFILVSASYASSEEKIWNLRIHFVVILPLPGRPSVNISHETNLTSGQTKPV